MAKVDGISPDKLKSLLAEGFTLPYLRKIMKPKLSKLNPGVDLNFNTRISLGINTLCTMTNHGINPIGKAK